MTKMKPRRKVTRQEGVQSTGPNWTLIGSIIGISAVVLIGLAVFASLNPAQAPEPTPALGQTVTNINDYCDTNPERCVMTGNLESSVTLIEIPDYGCPHCANFNATKAPSLYTSYVESNQIRWGIMPFALGDLTKPSAAAVLCVNEQDADLAHQFHTDLFGLQNTPNVHTANGFVNVASRIDGIDTDALEACVDDGRYDDDVSFNQQAARQMGVRSTPSFFLNGRLLSGDLEISVFEENIDAALN